MSEMDSEQFFLKWNNFESNLASGFADLLQREAMVDVTIAAEGKIVQAHKIILSICSSYFKNMFQVNPCQHPIVVLKDVRYQELTDMLDFMYKGEANVRQEDLPSFLKLAETLKVKGLAGSQGELDENSREKYYESNVSNLTKNSSSFLRVEPSNEFLDKESVVAKKKSKRCTSPFLYQTESKSHTHSPTIKLHMEECENNFLGNNLNNADKFACVKEERLSENSSDSYGDNHNVHETLEIDKNAGPSSLDENLDTLPQETLRGIRDYSFVESCFGGHLLILDGFSYRRKSVTSERSYWFCCRVKCPAKGILNANGKFKVTNFEHNHEPDFEKIRRKEKLVELKKLALRVNSSGQELLKALDIKEDVKKNLNFIRTCRRRYRKRNRNPIPIQPPLTAGLNYKCLPSRNSSKEILLYSGKFFRQDSVNPHNDKCKYWRCRVKKCKARVKTDDTGNLTILNPLHNHVSEKNDDTTSYLSQTVKTETSCLQTFPTEIIDKQTIKRDDLTKFSWKVRKKVERQRQEKLEMNKDLNFVEKGNFALYPSALDSENFSFEKLVAETLSESCCVVTRFSELSNPMENN